MSDSTRAGIAGADSLPPGQSERRRFARVMDAIGLEFLSRATDSGAESASGDVPVTIANHYDLAGYAEVKRDFPEVTDYIDQLEERIRQLQLGGNVLTEAPTHKVILSASGMVFTEDRLLQPGDVVPLRLTLFPAMQRIRCAGTVVSVGDVTDLVSDTQHSYRVVFSTLSPEDAATIDRHVQALCKSLRQRPLE